MVSLPKNPIVHSAFATFTASFTSVIDPHEFAAAPIATIFVLSSAMVAIFETSIVQSSRLKSKTLT